MFGYPRILILLNLGLPQEYCPDVITAGFDRDEEMDNSLSIACVVGEDIQISFTGRATKRGWGG